MNRDRPLTSFIFHSAFKTALKRFQTHIGFYYEFRSAFETLLKRFQTRIGFL